MKPSQEKCLVFSFGVNHDDSFESVMHTEHGCRIYSFDPFIENDRAKKIRESDERLTPQVELTINNKWKFYRLGLGGQETAKDIKIGDILSLHQILNYTNTRGQVIDVLKMDIEGAEKDLFASLDIDYLCTYVKQFCLETHRDFRQIAVEQLRRLEKCFYLFHRNTRFFMADTYGPTGHLTLVFCFR